MVQDVDLGHVICNMTPNMGLHMITNVALIWLQVWPSYDCACDLSMTQEVVGGPASFLAKNYLQQVEI